MGTIFISHSSKDNAIATELKRRLEIQGHRSVFLDFDPEFGIPPGRNWEQELYRELRACQAVIVLCSTHSMSSRWCFVEITHAKSLGKLVFPVKVAPCTIDPILTSRQIIDLTQDAEDAYQRLWEGLKVAGLDPEDTFDWDRNRSPYPGMMAFQEEDAAVFFGRETEIQHGLETFQRLRQFGGARMLLVLGASGSGKSSLVRAGLLPRLRRNPEQWLIVDPFRPQDHPLRELSIVIAKAFSFTGQKRNWKELCEPLEQAAAAGTTQNKSILKDICLDLQIESGCRESTLLLVIDQAEELLLHCPEERAEAFLSVLSAALTQTHSPLMAIFTLRSDFLADFQRQKSLMGLAREHFPVGPMTPDCFPKIIEGPAAIAALELEEGLTEAMVRDTENQDALPLLAFTLRELYERCGDDKRLAVKEYKENLGGLGGAVSRAAEAALTAGQLPADQVQVLRKALVSLACINEEGQFTRQAVPWSDLPESVHDALESFVQARLLISRGREAEKVLEVAHETLFSSWTKLRDWLFEDREFLLWKRRFGLLFGEWQHTGKNKAALLRGPSLKEARRWQRQRPKYLSLHEEKFIKNSLRLANRGKRIRRSLIALMLLGLTLGVTIQQWFKSNDFQVRQILFAAPTFLPRASLSTGTRFFHTADIAGRIMDIGTIKSDLPLFKTLIQRIKFPFEEAQLQTLLRASRFLSYRGKNVQASDLIDKMLEVARQVKDLHANPKLLAAIAITMHVAGRAREAGNFADKALAAANSLADHDSRIVAIGLVSQILAMVGMRREAEMAVKEILDALPEFENRNTRELLTTYISLTLIRLGRMEQAMAAFHREGDPQALPLVTQALVDEGRQEEAWSLALKYKNPFSMMIIASAFTRAGKTDRSRTAVKEALNSLSRFPLSPITLRTRELLLSKVLLKLTTVSEALSMLKELGDSNGLALLAVDLAEKKEPSLTREAAQAAIASAQATPETGTRSHALSLAAKSFALIGDAEEAMALVQEMDDEDVRTLTLSYVAEGLAERGDLNRAKAILLELDERMVKITNRTLKSLAWANSAKVQIYLDNYNAAFNADNIEPFPEDRISVFETVLREHTIKQHPEAMKLFAGEAAAGLGKFGVQWP